jgi:hypothetical protein
MLRKLRKRRRGGWLLILRDALPTARLCYGLSGS